MDLTVDRCDPDTPNTIRPKMHPGSWSIQGLAPHLPYKLRDKIDVNKFSSNSVFSSCELYYWNSYCYSHSSRATHLVSEKPKSSGRVCEISQYVAWQFTVPRPQPSKIRQRADFRITRYLPGHIPKCTRNILQRETFWNLQVSVGCAFYWLSLSQSLAPCHRLCQRLRHWLQHSMSRRNSSIDLRRRWPVNTVIDIVIDIWWRPIFQRPCVRLHLR